MVGETGACEETTSTLGSATRTRRNQLGGEYAGRCRVRQGESSQPGANSRRNGPEMFPPSEPICPFRWAVRLPYSAKIRGGTRSASLAGASPPTHIAKHTLLRSTLLGLSQPHNVDAGVFRVPETSSVGCNR